MPPLGKQRHFEILRQVLATAEERRAISLDDAAAEVGVTPEQLKDLLDPVLFLAFRTGLGDLIEQSRSFLLTEDDEIIVDREHWLRDLAADPPTPDVALRLLVAGHRDAELRHARHARARLGGREAQRGRRHPPRRVGAGTAGARSGA